MLSTTNSRHQAIGDENAVKRNFASEGPRNKERRGLSTLSESKSANKFQLSVPSANPVKPRRALADIKNIAEDLPARQENKKSGKAEASLKPLTTPDAILTAQAPPVTAESKPTSGKTSWSPPEKLMGLSGAEMEAQEQLQLNQLVEAQVRSIRQRFEKADARAAAAHGVISRDRILFEPYSDTEDELESLPEIQTELPDIPDWFASLEFGGPAPWC